MLVFLRYTLIDILVFFLEFELRISLIF